MFIVAEDDVSRLERQTLYRVSPKKVPSIEIYPIVVKHRILCDW
jgi:hypothetical protein